MTIDLKKPLRQAAKEGDLIDFKLNREKYYCDIILLNRREIWCTQISPWLSESGLSWFLNIFNKNVLFS